MSTEEEISPSIDKVEPITNIITEFIVNTENDKSILKANDLEYFFYLNILLNNISIK
jgi:hypothetical protein